MKNRRILRHAPCFAIAMAAMAAIAALTAAGAHAEDAPAADAPAAEQKIDLAPPGECAKPRGLADAAEPSGFDVAGSPASRLVPASVAATVSTMGPAGARPVPPPNPPGPPSSSLCDEPAGCSAPRPAFVESEPVPSLPPGARP